METGLKVDYYVRLFDICFSVSEIARLYETGRDIGNGEVIL